MQAGGLGRKTMALAWVDGPRQVIRIERRQVVLIKECERGLPQGDWDGLYSATYLSRRSGTVLALVQACHEAVCGAAGSRL